MAKAWQKGYTFKHDFHKQIFFFRETNLTVHFWPIWIFRPIVAGKFPAWKSKFWRFSRCFPVLTTRTYSRTVPNFRRTLSSEDSSLEWAAMKNKMPAEKLLQLIHKSGLGFNESSELAFSRNLVWFVWGKVGTLEMSKLVLFLVLFMLVFARESDELD